jgi:hypothetical protein
LSERNASIKWAEQFQNYLGCVRCGSKEGLHLKEHGGSVIEPESLPLEELQRRVPEYDVWCSNCQYKFLRLRMFAMGRVANKEDAAEYARIAVYAHYSRGGMAYNAYTLSQNVQITKKELLELAKDDQCMHCKTTYTPAVMDFHHVIKPKIKTVESMPGGHWTIHQMITEMEKCVLLCANCHRMVHASDLTLSKVDENLWKLARIEPKLARLAQKTSENTV